MAELVKEGYLEVKRDGHPRFGPQLQKYRRQFVRLYRGIPAIQSQSSRKKKQVPKTSIPTIQITENEQMNGEVYTIPLERIWNVIEKQSKNSKRWCFELYHDGMILVTLACSSEAEREEWLSCFSNLKAPSELSSGSHDTYQVNVGKTDGSAELGISGGYTLSIGRRGLVLKTTSGHEVQEWSFPSVRQLARGTDRPDLLALEVVRDKCGLSFEFSMDELSLLKLLKEWEAVAKDQLPPPTHSDSPLPEQPGTSPLLSQDAPARPSHHHQTTVPNLPPALPDRSSVSISLWEAKRESRDFPDWGLWREERGGRGGVASPSESGGSSGNIYDSDPAHPSGPPPGDRQAVRPAGDTTTSPDTYTVETPSGQHMYMHVQPSGPSSLEVDPKAAAAGSGRDRSATMPDSQSSFAHRHGKRVVRPKVQASFDDGGRSLSSVSTDAGALTRGSLQAGPLPPQHPSAAPAAAMFHPYDTPASFPIIHMSSPPPAVKRKLQGAAARTVSNSVSTQTNSATGDDDDTLCWCCSSESLADSSDQLPCGGSSVYSSGENDRGPYADLPPPLPPREDEHPYDNIHVNKEYVNILRAPIPPALPPKPLSLVEKHKQSTSDTKPHRCTCPRSRDKLHYVSSNDSKASVMTKTSVVSKSESSSAVLVDPAAGRPEDRNGPPPLPALDYHLVDPPPKPMPEQRPSPTKPPPLPPHKPPPLPRRLNNSAEKSLPPHSSSAPAKPPPLPPHSYISVDKTPSSTSQYHNVSTSPPNQSSASPSASGNSGVSHAQHKSEPIYENPAFVPVSTAPAVSSQVPGNPLTGSYSTSSDSVFVPQSVPTGKKGGSEDLGVPHMRAPHSQGVNHSQFMTMSGSDVTPQHPPPLTSMAYWSGGDPNALPLSHPYSFPPKSLFQPPSPISGAGITVDEAVQPSAPSLSFTAPLSQFVNAGALQDVCRNTVTPRSSSTLSDSASGTNTDFPPPLPLSVPQQQQFPPPLANFNPLEREDSTYSSVSSVPRYNPESPGQIEMDKELLKRLQEDYDSNRLQLVDVGGGGLLLDPHSLDAPQPASTTTVDDPMDPQLMLQLLAGAHSQKPLTPQPQPQLTTQDLLSNIQQMRTQSEVLALQQMLQQQRLQQILSHQYAPHMQVPPFSTASLLGSSGGLGLTANPMSFPISAMMHNQMQPSYQMGGPALPPAYYAAMATQLPMMPNQSPSPIHFPYPNLPGGEAFMPFAGASLQPSSGSVPDIANSDLFQSGPAVNPPPQAPSTVLPPGPLAAANMNTHSNVDLPSSSSVAAANNSNGSGNRGAVDVARWASAVAHATALENTTTNSDVSLPHDFAHANGSNPDLSLTSGLQLPLAGPFTSPPSPRPVFGEAPEVSTTRLAKNSGESFANSPPNAAASSTLSVSPPPPSKATPPPARHTPAEPMPVYANIISPAPPTEGQQTSLPTYVNALPGGTSPPGAGGSSYAGRSTPGSDRPVNGGTRGAGAAPISPTSPSAMYVNDAVCVDGGTVVPYPPDGPQPYLHPSDVDPVPQGPSAGHFQSGGGGRIGHRILQRVVNGPKASLSKLSKSESNSSSTAAATTSTATSTSPGSTASISTTDSKQIYREIQERVRMQYAQDSGGSSSRSPHGSARRRKSSMGSGGGGDSRGGVSRKSSAAGGESRIPSHRCECGGSPKSPKNSSHRKKPSPNGGQMQTVKPLAPPPVPERTNVPQRLDDFVPDRQRRSAVDPASLDPSLPEAFIASRRMHQQHGGGSGGFTSTGLLNELASRLAPSHPSPVQATQIRPHLHSGAS